MKIEIYPPLSILEIGQRTNQEDAIALWENRLFVLCDGMGGHEHGEVASQTVCQAIVNWCNARALEPLSEAQVEDAIYYAYARLDEKDKGELRKMGTTLTLLYIGSTGVLAAHIGDSRIYHIRPKSSHTGEGQGEAVLYQSRDHSLVFDLFQAGEITFEEMATYPQKNIITRAMQPGAENRMRPDIVHITDVQPGDYFYMCSDGMLEQMTNEELVTLLSSDISDEEKRDHLIKATTNNQDNHTAWLIHVKDVVKEDGDDKFDNEEPTSRYNAINIIKQRQKEVKESTEYSAINDNHNDSDDVIIVSTPNHEEIPSHRKPLPKFLLMILALCTLLFIGLCLMFLIRQCRTSKDLQKPTPMLMQRHHQVVERHTDTIKIVSPQQHVDTIKQSGQKKDTVRKTSKDNIIETLDL